MGFNQWVRDIPKTWGLDLALALDQPHQPRALTLHFSRDESEPGTHQGHRAGWMICRHFSLYSCPIANHSG